VALPRFLAADLDIVSGAATLSPEETHHLTAVLRLRFGDEVAVFDGNGREYRARIERVSRDGAQLKLLEQIEAAPEPAVRLTLAQAVLKGNRMDDVVRDATMMGVVAIEPLITAHTIARGALGDGRGPDRWRRIAIVSAKQCRRAVLPMIGAGTPLVDWVVQDSATLRVVLVEPGAGTPGRQLNVLRDEPRPASATIAVGPEGGWSQEELQVAIDAGWLPITLGRRTLRADAVPIVAIGVLQAMWGDL
jgi:16S rRNA (uracil1498-N3)-methyltransferase